MSLLGVRGTTKRQAPFSTGVLLGIMSMLPVTMRDSPTISTGSIESGSGGSLLALYARAGSNTSKTHFYQGADNSLISNGWFIFDDEL